VSGRAMRGPARFAATIGLGLVLSALALTDPQAGSLPSPKLNATETQSLQVDGIAGQLQCVHADASGHLSGTGFDCGAGAAVATVDLYYSTALGPTPTFTPGVTQSLTLTGTPTSAAQVKIWFDANFQDDDTYTVSGSTVTFANPIPASVQVVEVFFGAGAAGLPPINLGANGSGGVTGVLPPANGGTGGAAPPILQNLLSNTQWQVFASLDDIPKINALGNGTQANVAVTGFTPGVNYVTFTTANTQQLKAGDLIYFNASGLNFAPMHVISVTPNVSFTAYLPGQLSSPASAAVTAFPITVGEYPGVSINGPNGWQKTSSLALWRDDFPANSVPDSLYSLGMAKGSSATESLTRTIPNAQLAKFRGRNVAFGAWVLSRANVGNGDFQLCVNSSCSAVTGGTGAMQWVEVDATVSPTATSVVFSFDAEGSLGDTYYLADPMAAYASALGTGNYVQNQGEYVPFDNHINAPIFVPWTLTGPSTPWPGTSNDYGYEWDLEAITDGQIAHTVTAVDIQVEFNTGTVGANVLFGTCMCSPGAIFGTETDTQVASKTITSNSRLPLDTRGLYISGQSGYFAMYSGVSGLSFTNLTVDFSGAVLN
jgi:hypothetical protein